MSASATPSSPAPAASRWLHGPLPDLLLGCGGAYVFCVLLLLTPSVQGALMGWFGVGTILLGLVTNTPHYGATLLRVYEHRQDRRRYAFFSVWVTLALLALFVLGLRQRPVGSFLITAYTTWSPWHFAGQNYGLALMFLRRRGAPVTPGLKRMLYASFFLSFLLSFVTLHGDLSALDLAPIPTVAWGVFGFVSLNLPSVVSTAGLPLLSVAYLGLLAVVAVQLLRSSSARDLAPAAMLIALQAMWFSVPAMLRVSGRYSGENIALSTIWIAIFHSIQYLWITSYYATRSGERGHLPRYLGKTLLAGSALTVLPALFFAPWLLGSLPFHAGLAMLTFAMVNLHHFILDGAIWKLRDGAVARVLLRSAEDAARPGPLEPPRRSWLRPLVWSVGALCVAVGVFGSLEIEFGYQRAMKRKDLARAADANRRLAWIGREHHGIHNNLALHTARRLQEDPGSSDADWEAVRARYRRSLELLPTATAWLGLGTVHSYTEDYPEAAAAFEEAVALEPENVVVLRSLGEARLAQGEFPRAREALERARELAPSDAKVGAALRRLDKAEAKAGSRSGQRDARARKRAVAQGG